MIGRPDGWDVFLSGVVWFFVVIAVVAGVAEVLLVIARALWG